MGVKERRQREKVEFRDLVLHTASAMLKEKGLKSFSLRKLAEQLEFSASKLYLFFDSKDKIILALCDQICQRMLAALKAVPQYRDKEKYLLALTRAKMEFYRNEPESLDVVIYTCFGAKSIQPPASYLEQRTFFENAIKELNFPALQSEAKITEALDAFRFLHIGITQMLSIEPPESSSQRMAKSMETAIKIMICGWKHMDEVN